MRLNLLNHEVTNVHSAALLLAAAGLLSRALGILRDRMLAGTFGAGRELDIYYAAFQIPDFMSVVFLLGAGSAAILPIFQEYLARDRAEARELISRLVSLFSLGAIILAAAVFFLAPFLMHLVTPGFSEEDRAMTILLTRIMLLSPMLLGISSIFSAVVQSFQRFWSYAAAPIFYNVGIIIGVMVFVPLWGVAGLAGGVILGAFLHLLIQIVTIWQLGFAPSLAQHMFQLNAGVGRVIKISFPRVLSVSLSNITLLVLIAVGSGLAAGSIAVLNLAYNLYFVPIGIFGVSYAIAIFPRMSRAYIERDSREFFHELYIGVRTVLFWTVPSAVLFIVLRAHIVRAALGAGAFSWEDTRLTAAALAALAVSVAAGALSSLLIKGFYALENTWKPLFINIGASLVSIGGAIFWAQSLSHPSAFTGTILSLFRIADLPHPEVLGLAAGFSLGMLLNIIFLYWTLDRFAEKVFHECYPFPWGALFKIIMAALVGGAAAYFVRASFSETLPLITFLQVLLQGTASALVGFGVYFGTLYLLKSEDVHSFFAALRRRLFRVKSLPRVWDGETQVHQHRV